MTVPFRELDTVVLLRDSPDAGLRTGDLGAVVQIYAADALEVEFVTASGRTLALTTVSAMDVREVRDDDLLAVSPRNPPRCLTNRSAALERHRPRGDAGPLCMVRTAFSRAISPQCPSQEAGPGSESG
jgi:hypothetical protein